MSTALVKELSALRLNDAASLEALTAGAAKAAASPAEAALLAQLPAVLKATADKVSPWLGLNCTGGGASRAAEASGRPSSVDAPCAPPPRHAHCLPPGKAPHIASLAAGDAWAQCGARQTGSGPPPAIRLMSLRPSRQFWGG